jgi:hypothetical protein
MKAIIIIALIGLSISGSAQFKIGQTTVPDTTGRAFLKWCHSRLDTVIDKTAEDFLKDYKTTSPDFKMQQQAQIQANLYEKYIRDSAVKTISAPGQKPRYVVYRKPTEELLKQWLKSRQ